MPRDCPGFNVTGNVAPDTENPVPVAVAEFTVTLPDPVELNVRDWVVGLFMVVLPNEMLVAFTDSVAVPVFNCRVSDFDVLPVEAVRFTDFAVLFAAAGTLTVVGTVTVELLLARATVTPPDGAEPDRLTLQASTSAPKMEMLAHDRPLMVGAAVVPVPLRLTVAGDELLAIVSLPVAEVAVVGAY
jgi:hypothetical protein